MFARKLMLSTLFLSSIATAAPQSREQIISEITAEPTNGGINPQFTGVRLKGYVQLGNNACEASRYSVSIEKKNKGGRHILVATAKETVSDRVCPLFVDLNHKGVAFDQSVILKSSTSFDKVFVANVGSKGNLVTLASLLDAEQTPDLEKPIEGACDENVMCTMEFNPTTCTDADGNTFSGSNRCAAVANAKQAACLRGETLDLSALSCVSGEAL